MRTHCTEARRGPFPRAIIALALVLAMTIPGLAPAIPAQVPEDGPPDGGSRAQAKWTYLVYMSADNNLEDEAILNVNQAEAVGSSEDINVVIQLDRHPDYDTTNGDWTEARRYYVTSDADVDVIGSELVESLGEVDMGRWEVLRDFVVWGVTTYPADRYYLDLWGHGGGWKDGTCNDYTSGTVIDTDELGQALAEAEGLTGVALDGLGFDQCLMAQLEVFYEIKARADVLVGAETLIPSEGYNYTRVLGSLALDPDMDASGLADVIVEAFFDEYGYRNDRAHSAVDAEEMDARLVPSVNRLAQLLRGKAGTLHEEIRMARNTAQTYSNTNYIDLGNFTERLLVYLPANETGLRRAAIEVRENVTAAVVAEGHGIDRAGSTGLSHYFPESSVVWSYTRLQMSVEQRWDEFLDAYFDDRDRPNEAPAVQVTGPMAGSVVGLEFEMTGTAIDADGNVTAVEWKFDRGPWSSAAADTSWALTVSSEGLEEGLHRLSVRSRDDVGDYSDEVQLQLNIQSRGLVLSTDPPEVRSHAGGGATSRVTVQAYGERGGTMSLEVLHAPAGWDVVLPFTGGDLSAGGWKAGDLEVDVPTTVVDGTYQLILMTSLVDAPLIRAYATLGVNVTRPWADLVVTDVSIDPAEPEQGDNVTVTATIENTGHVTALSFDVGVMYRREPNTTRGDVPWETILHRHVTSLDAGETIVISAQQVVGLGLHTFHVLADPMGNNSDLEPADNQRTVSVLIEGYGVRLLVDPQELEVSPGTSAWVQVHVTNIGNLQDIFQLLVASSTQGWRAKLNETAFLLGPRGSAEVRLDVEVPPDALGGTEEVITLQLKSYNDPTKEALATLRLFYPEVFVLDVSQDREDDVIGNLGTTSFNITITNGGNGLETYTLDYVHQTSDLFVSAVNESVDVAPGCSTLVEVFVSSLGTEVGGKSFEVNVTIRSLDDAITLARVSFTVSVRLEFGLTAKLVQPSLQGFPGQTLTAQLTVTSGSNYPMGIVVAVTGEEELMAPDQLLRQDLPAGDTQTLELMLPLRRQVVMGDYDLLLLVHEVGDEGNGTVVTVPVSVLRVDAASISVEHTDELPLTPKRPWTATLLIINGGNHPENYQLNVSGVPGYMAVHVEPSSVEVPAYDQRLVLINVTVEGDAENAPRSLMLTVTATAVNITGTVPTAVLDVPLDIPRPEDEGSLWLIWLTLALVLAVVALTMFLLRRR